MALILKVEGYAVRKPAICSVLFLILISLIQVLFSADSIGEYIPRSDLSSRPSLDPAISQGQAVNAALNFGRMPIQFIPNEGQMDERVAYYVKGKDKTVYFTSEGLTIALNGPSERWVVKLDFVGSNPRVKPSGMKKTGAVVSYFKGKPEDWQTGLTAYSKIIYEDLWPGIDLVYSGSYGELKYEFIVHPEADPSLIRLAYRGNTRLEVTADGALKIETPLGTFRDGTPLAYQEINGQRVNVSMGFRLDARPTDDYDANPGQEEPGACPYTYGFSIGEYDRTRPLILDPVLIVYCGYIGGSLIDTGWSIAVDPSGCAYVAGVTSSSETSFPETTGPDLAYNGNEDVFVAKVNASGTGLDYCGYIGGSSDDKSPTIAVDTSGNAYVAGITYSDESSFPVATGPDLSFNGTQDAFVAKVNASGTALVYCGYIGGTIDDWGSGIAVDSSGQAYVTGTTYSSETTYGFPVLVGPDLSYNGGADAFVAKVNASGTALVYCGYLGGTSYDEGNSVAVDGSGNAYVTGRTYSNETSFPVATGPDTTFNGDQDAYVAKVNAGGTGLTYCGYVGGSDFDLAETVVVDSSNNAYIVGRTYSEETSFPVTVGPDLTYNGSQDAFVAKVNATGASLAYCGYIGGSSWDYGFGLAVDSTGNAYVTGQTLSTEASFPVTVGPDITFSPSSDAYIAKVNTSGTALVFCGYIGGGGDDIGRGIALDHSNNAYIMGATSADESTFPVTVGPDLTYNGDIYDAFVAKIHEEPIWKPRHAVGDFDGDGSDEAAVDFGAAGIYLYNGGSWTQLSASNPESLVAADVDGDTVAEFLADLGASGLWLWNAGVWNQLSGVNAEGIAAGDVDSDGADEVVGDFGVIGLWLCNGGTWSQLSGVNADYIDCADLDGSGGEEIVGDFGATGLWLWNTSVWTQLSGVNADYMVFGDANGLTGEELFGDFGWAGLWLWSSAGGWTQLSGLDLDFMGIMQADGDAQNEFVGDFGAAGMWLWDEGTWVQSTGADADFLIILDVDGDAVDEGVVDFGSLGVWLGSTSSDWVQLSGVNAEYMMAGDLDGDNTDEIMADFGTLGLWLWDDGAWSQISASNPE